MATPTFSAKLPDVTMQQLAELAAQFGVSKSQIVIQAVRQLHQQEIKTMSNEKNLTDNAWVARVNELRQMVADLPTAVTSQEDIDFYMESPDFFNTPDFDNADKTMLKREMRRQYPIE